MAVILLVVSNTFRKSFNYGYFFESNFFTILRDPMGVEIK